MVTLMGIAWGTFAVVAMLAFGAGLENMMRERAEGMGKAVIVTWVNSTTMSFRGFPKGRQLLATDEDILALATEVEGIGGVSPEYLRNEQVRMGDRQFRTSLAGVFPAYGKMRSMTPEAGGRFLNAEDQRLGRRVMFLGDKIKRQLLGEDDAIGKQVVLAGSPFTMIGVLKPKEQDSDYNGLDESRISIPASTYRRLFGDRFVDDFVFQAKHLGDTSAVIDGVYRVLGRRLGFDPRDREALNVWDTTEGEKVRETMFLSLRILVSLAGGLTLLVGGLGIGNLMYLLVKRRTSEIGLQMALGARPRWVLWEIMVQTMLLVGLGGLLGFIGAWAVATVVAKTPLREAVGEPTISLNSAAATVGLLLIVGLASGLSPARRAARLDPVQALLD